MSKIVNQGEKGWSKMLKICQLSLWGTPWIENLHLHIHEFSLEWIYWWYIFCSESDQDFLQNLFCPKNEFWKLEFWQFFNFKVLWKECWWICTLNKFIFMGTIDSTDKQTEVFNPRAFYFYRVPEGKKGSMYLQIVL